jgi:hypothetical protein
MVKVFVPVKKMFVVLMWICLLLAAQEGVERIVFQATPEDSEEKRRRFWWEG